MFKRVVSEECGAIQSVDTISVSEGHAAWWGQHVPKSVSKLLPDRVS